MRDRVTIILSDGERHEDIRASVQRKQVIINDTTIPISVGDRIERSLPSGQKEILIATNVHLWTGGVRIPDHYEIDYEREGTERSRSEVPGVNVNVSDSPQARVNVNSTDQSTNTIHQQREEVFSGIRQLLDESVTDQSELALLHQKIEDMESNLGSGDFTTAYQDFIAAAANHMTVLAPMLPALTGLLS